MRDLDIGQEASPSPERTKSASRPVSLTTSWCPVSIWIMEWKRASNEKYSATVAPRACSETADGCVVTGMVNGNFPGSPVRQAFAFKLDAAKIAVLKITP